MAYRLFILIFVLGVAADSRAQSGGPWASRLVFLRDCARFLSGFRPRPEETIPGVPNSDFAVFERIRLGDRLRFSLNSGGEREGVVTDTGMHGMSVYENAKEVLIYYSAVKNWELVSRGNPIPDAVKAQAEGRRKKQDRLQAYVREQKRYNRTWEDLKGPLREEWQTFKKLSSKEQKALVDKTAEDLEKQFRDVFKIEKIGRHYNMHSGVGQQYVDAGGIRMGHGNSAIYFGGIDASGDPTRGMTPVLFYYESEKPGELARFFSKVQITQSSASSPGRFWIFFDTEAVRKKPYVGPYQGMDGKAFSFENVPPEVGSIGVPWENFLLPPLPLGVDVDRKLGLEKEWVSNHFLRYAALRHLQRFLAEK